MREIDFLPAWYRVSQRRRRDLAVRITCLCVLVGAMIAWSAMNIAVVRAAEADLAVVHASYELQGEALEQLAALGSRLTELKERQALWRTVRSGARADQILAELSRLMPQAMMLTRVSLKQDERLPSVTGRNETTSATAADLMGHLEIEGIAASNAEVGSLHTALVRSPCFEDVQMMYARPVIRAGRQGREFRLSCRLPRFE